MAHAAVQENDYRRVANFLGLTVLLGLGFLGMKGLEYSIEIKHGFLPSAGIFWSFYYGMTGLHALHVLAGVLVNVVLWIGALKGTLARHGHRVELAGLYWHLVDIIWIFIFSANIPRVMEMNMSNAHSRHYLIIWYWLLALVIASVVAASIMPKFQAMVLVFSIAIIKALLVARNYMHLKNEKAIYYALALVPLAFILVLLFVLFPDLVFHATRR
jgi:caa(3)-type oxidase subunit IV